MRFRTFFLLVSTFLLSPGIGRDSSAADGESKFARADSLSGYVHWIELFDDQVSKIDPTKEAPKPYSPLKTCGRCHDYNSIAHGWHFDAVERTEKGRPGQPWIWSDGRTGTYLPLSYRGWKGSFDPDKLGISRWAVAKQFGGYLPGGGPGSPDGLASLNAPVSPVNADGAPPFPSPNRSDVTGPLPIDCMLCHRNDRSYNPEIWTKQIDTENFPFAPTVAAGLATIEGTLERIKSKSEATGNDDSDPPPMLKYDLSRFRNDGKVFFDIVRKPLNNSCNYCHTNLSVESFGAKRWTHDDDVHLRAGMACADCHRNGLDHQTVRGFEGEGHARPEAIASLSCRGCHIDSGRMGAPLPAHRGLPPLHFEKMSCTSCHSGSIVDSEPSRILNSIAHQLGRSAHRTPDELPAIVAPVMLTIAKDIDETDQQEIDRESATSSEKIYTPHRMTWPAYWGLLKENRIEPLEPENAFQLTRKILKVRKNMSEELIAVKPSLSERKAILGEDRYKTKEAELTDEEVKRLQEWMERQGQKQLRTRLADAMAAIEKVYPEHTAVYIAGGKGYRRSSANGDDPIESIPPNELGEAANPYAWPMAHDVRPARLSLGAKGCYECHDNNAPFFTSKITAVGTLPGFETAEKSAYELQGIDFQRISQWSTLFEGRTAFKIFAFICLALLSLIILGSLAWSIAGRLSRIGSP